jgi:nitroreductase
MLLVIKERRSVRIFNGDKIAEDMILKIIEAAIWAPTGCNNQELRFLILNTEKEIQEILPFKPFFKGVSTIVLLFFDMSLPMSQKMYVKYKAEKNLPYIDTGLALSNMVLYAKSQGIDSCVFNLSEYHLEVSRNRKIQLRKLIDFFKLKLGLYKYVESNFEFYLRNRLKLPSNLRVTCGVAFGHAKIYPDLKRDSHGGRKLMRDNIEKYIIKKP